MKRTGHFRFAGLAGAADHTPGKDHLLFMRAKVLGSVPLPPPGKIKDGDLFFAIADAGAAVGRHVVDAAGQPPFGDGVLLSGGGDTVVLRSGDGILLSGGGGIFLSRGGVLLFCSNAASIRGGRCGMGGRMLGGDIGCHIE